MTRRPARRHDDGFTLIELLIAMTVSGVILTTVVASFMLALGATTGSEKRMAASHDAQLIEIYFPADLQSASSVDATSTATSGCAGSSPGANVLKLAWTEVITSAGTTTFNASYRLAQNDGEWQIVRYYCSNGGTATVTTVAHALYPPTNPAIPTTSPGPIDALQICGNRVALTLHEFDGSSYADSFSYTVAGSPRTPTTAVTVACPGATTTAPTSTSAAPATLSSLQMKDADTDGLVDQLVATFSASLNAACNTGWSLSNVPSGGTIGSVAISTTTATVSINEGAGAKNTAVGTFTASFTPAGACNASAFSSASPTDAAGPVVTAISSSDNDGKIEPADVLTISFSENVTGVAGAVTITEADASTDQLTISNVTNGARSMGSTGYVDNSKTARFAGVVATATTNVTVTVGICDVTSDCSKVNGSSGALGFQPNAAIKDSTGNSAGGSFTTAASFKVF